jgi:hypothetical protein
LTDDCGVSFQMPLVSMKYTLPLASIETAVEFTARIGARKVFGKRHRA